MFYSILSFLSSNFISRRKRRLVGMLKQQPYLLYVKDSEVYEIDFRSNGKLYSDQGLFSSWHVLSKNKRLHLQIKLLDKTIYLLKLYADSVWRQQADNKNHFKSVELHPKKKRGLSNSSDFTSLENFKLNGKGDLQTIHVLLAGQLGNCLRNIASIKILADHIGVDWDIDLKKGFASNGAKAIIRKLFPNKKQKENNYHIVHELDVIDFSDIYGTNSNPLIEGDFTLLHKKNFGVCHIYAVKPANMNLEDYLRKKIEFYKGIEFPEVIIKRSKNFINSSCNGKISTLIGVHIRYTDNLDDDMKAYNKFNTSIEAFVERISRIRGATILLCTDNKKVIDIIRASVSNIVSIILPDQLEPEDSILQPLYEMYLLAQTKLIIGSYSSTFSYESCFIKGTDLELYFNDNWVRYSIAPYA